jgi:hypothetical protein
MWSYLSTYRIFAPPLQLLKMWMDMYAEYAADSADDYSREFNHRMVLFMRYWVDHFFDQDFKCVVLLVCSSRYLVRGRTFSLIFEDVTVSANSERATGISLHSTSSWTSSTRTFLARRPIGSSWPL